MTIARTNMEDPSRLHKNAGVETDEYTGPHGETSYQKGYRTSFETKGGAFTSKGIASGHTGLAGSSAQNLSGLVKWDAGSSNPGFNQNV